MDSSMKAQPEGRRTTPHQISPAARPGPAVQVPSGGAASTLAARDILFLQRTIGNRATTQRLSAVLQRTFAGDIKDFEVNVVIAKLKELYPGQDDRISRSTISQLRISEKPYDLAGLAAALGLKPGGGTQLPITPPNPNAMSPAMVPVPSKREVVIALPKPLATVPQAVSKPLALDLAKGKEPVKDSELEVEKVVLAQPQEAIGTATTFDLDALRARIVQLYTAKKSPQKDDFLQLFKSLYHPDHILSIMGSTPFAYGFQELIREQIKPTTEANKRFLEATKITDLIADDAKVEKYKSYKMGDISKWKLRHYSDKGTDTEPPPFLSISSTAAIPFLTKAPINPEDVGEAKPEEKKKKSGHTGDRDWNRYGNTGSTFFLLCVDGQLYGKQEFLKNTRWYVEFDFDQPSLWLSSDWLDEAGITGPAVRGRGKDVHSELLKLVGNVSGEAFERTLVGMFHNLEVKVPGPLTFAKSAWIKK